MMCTEESRRTGTPQRAPAVRRGGINPAFPLLLLQTMRDMDRPTEVLEDEDLTMSLPRRFGLSDVVSRHMHRLQEEVRRRRPQTVPEVEDLIRLVVRRPDAEAIFLETGRRIADEEWEARSRATRSAARWLPRPLAVAAAVRAIRRVLRQLVGDARLRIQRRPLELLIADSLTARADPGGTACAIYSGVLEQLLTRYTSRSCSVLHPHCQARGADSCQWTVQAG